MYVVILTILKKFLLIAFFASGLFITNKAIPEKKIKRFSLAELLVGDTYLKTKHPEFI